MKRIKLTKSKYAIVDDADFEYLNQWKWYFHGKYAVRSQHIGMENGKQIKNNIMMHRIINKTPEGMDTDHINRNKLDNRRINLRSCSRSENLFNKAVQSNSKSGYKGVSWHPQRSKFQAYICIDRRKKSLGYFVTAIDAARAYDKAALFLRGEFTRTNLTRVG